MDTEWPVTFGWRVKIALVIGALTYAVTKDVKKSAVAGAAYMVFYKPIDNLAYQVIKGRG